MTRRASVCPIRVIGPVTAALIALKVAVHSPGSIERLALGGVEKQ